MATRIERITAIAGGLKRLRISRVAPIAALIIGALMEAHSQGKGLSSSQVDKIIDEISGKLDKA